MSLIRNNYFNVLNYGAKGDGTYVSGAAITTGTATLTVSSGSFTSADIGKYIEVGGAGTSGARLITTILAVTNTNTITLANNASTTVSGQKALYGTNNTTAFQNAINATLKSDGSYNGRVFIPIGYYLFTSSVVTTDGTNSVNNAQIFIPMATLSGTNYTVYKMGTIEIVGEVAPNHFADPTTQTTSVALNGVILHSTLNQSNGCLLGNAYTSIGTQCLGLETFINFTETHFSNIRFRVNSKNGNTDVTNSMNAVDLSNMGMLIADNVVCDNESIPYYNVTPIAGWGFKTMGLCNWAVQRFSNIYVCNFYNGFSFSEHQDNTNIFVIACVNGVVVTQNLHACYISRLLTQWCINNIKIEGRATFSIAQYDAENVTSGPYVNVYDIYEPSTTNSYADIKYNIVGPPDFSNPHANTIKLSSNVSSGIVTSKIGTAVSTPDTTAPTVISAVATSATNIRITFSESMSAVTTAGWSFNNGGAITPSAVALNSGNIYDFTVAGLASGQTITMSYNPSTGATLDTASNEVATISGATVTNSIGGSVTNLFRYSRQLSQSTYWVQNGATITENASTAQDGLTKADKLVESVGTNSNNGHYVQQDVSVTGLQYTYSIYLKGGERTQALVGFYCPDVTGLDAIVDLSTGTIGTVQNPGGTASFSRSIAADGNGYYKFSLTFTRTLGTTVTGNFYVYLTNGSTLISYKYSGDGSSGLYIGGAQLETGATANTLVETF